MFDLLSLNGANTYPIYTDDHAFMLPNKEIVSLANVFRGGLVYGRHFTADKMESLFKITGKLTGIQPIVIVAMVDKLADQFVLKEKNFLFLELSRNKNIFTSANDFLIADDKYPVKIFTAAFNNEAMVLITGKGEASHDYLFLAIGCEKVNGKSEIKVSVNSNVKHANFGTWNLSSFTHYPVEGNIAIKDMPDLTFLNLLTSPETKVSVDIVSAATSGTNDEAVEKPKKRVTAKPKPRKPRESTQLKKLREQTDGVMNLSEYPEFPKTSVAETVEAIKDRSTLLKYLNELTEKVSSFDHEQMTLDDTDILQDLKTVASHFIDEVDAVAVRVNDEDAFRDLREERFSQRYSLDEVVTSPKRGGYDRDRGGYRERRFGRR